MAQMNTESAIAELREIVDDEIARAKAGDLEALGVLAYIADELKKAIAGWQDDAPPGVGG